MINKTHTLNPILDTRMSVLLLLLLLFCNAQGTPLWILKCDGLESSGQRLISLNCKTFFSAFFLLFSPNFLRCLTIPDFFLWILGSFFVNIFFAYDLSLFVLRQFLQCRIFSRFLLKLLRLLLNIT